MPRSLRARHLSALLLALVALSATPVRAADHFLTIGGGNAPSHNQVSLEKNVLYFEQVLGGFGIDPKLHDIYFSDGADPTRVVQYRPHEAVPRVNALLAQIFDNSDEAEVAYRKVEIPGVRGPSNRQNLSQWFDTVGSKLGEGDRLLIYFTGHGGGGRPVRNTTLTLWNERDMEVKEFAQLLDKLPPKVQVVLVMVQCHSGGFADVIFKGGEAKPSPDALNDRNRCGFFAAIPERVAAGCTADLNEDNYHEYSTFFFEALCGRSRTGKAIDRPDYDSDGKVSFAEAHAYVKLHSDTIDVPVSTSEVLLRDFSRAPGASSAEPAPPVPPRRGRRGGVAREEAAGGSTAAPTLPPGVDAEQLLSPWSPYDQLHAAASPVQRAVLDGLSEELNLFGLRRLQDARKAQEQIGKQMDQAAADRRQLGKDYDAERNKLAAALKSRWPEFATPWHPRVQQILKDEADDVVKTIESHEAYKRFDQLARTIDALDTRSLDLERKWVKYQRLVREANDVALAANLPKVAPKEIQERYAELVAAENGTIGTAANGTN